MKKIVQKTSAVALGLLLSCVVWAGLETGTYISDLVATNPLSSDLASTSDDHIRLVKSTVKATFPNINGAVSASDENLSLLNGLSGTVWTSANDGSASGLDADTIDGTAIVGSQIWTSANDGSGSGLSADVLDGLSSADFAQIAATNTFTQVQLFADGGSSAPALAFSADSNTGIYRANADEVRLVSGGQVSLIAAAGFIEAPGVGSAGAPSIRLNDADTGFYPIDTNRVGFSEGGTGYYVGFRNIPQNAQTGNYTLVLDDAGRHIYHASGAGSGDTYTIPANGSVAYPLGTTITFINSDSNSISIAITTDTLTLGGTTSTGTRTLGQNGVATAVKVTTTSWIISGTGLSWAAEPELVDVSGFFDSMERAA